MEMQKTVYKNNYGRCPKPLGSRRPVSAWPWCDEGLSTKGCEVSSRSNVLNELLMKHGRQLDKFPIQFPSNTITTSQFPSNTRTSSQFPSNTRTTSQFLPKRPRTSNAWYCNNIAFRQMYSTSARTPRQRRFNGSITIYCIPGGTVKPQGISTNSIISRTKSAPPLRSLRVTPKSTLQHTHIT